MPAERRKRTGGAPTTRQPSAADLDASPSIVGKIQVYTIARAGDPNVDGARRPLKLRSRLEYVEGGADGGGARCAAGHLKVPLAEPSAKAFAADWPRLSMTVDMEIGEGRAIGRTEEVRLEPNSDQALGADPGLRARLIFHGFVGEPVSFGWP